MSRSQKFQVGEIVVWVGVGWVIAQTQCQILGYRKNKVYFKLVGSELELNVKSDLVFRKRNPLERLL
jgi:hypothetical protein